MVDKLVARPPVCLNLQVIMNTHRLATIPRGQCFDKLYNYWPFDQLHDPDVLAGGEGSIRPFETLAI